jgi:hypothetical protein
MAGSTMVRRQDPMAAAAEFGDQLVQAWQSFSSATESLVGATSASLAGLAEKQVALIKPRATEAAAWLSALHQQTVRVVDDSVALGLKQLGIPTHADYVALAARMDRLSASVRRLEAGSVRKAPRTQPAGRRTR